jgi:competence protein ComEA
MLRSETEDGWDVKTVFKFAVVLFAVWAVLSLPHAGRAQGSSPQTPAAAPVAAPAAVLPEGNGRIQVVNTCGQCHSLDLVMAKHQTKKEWTATVNLMIERGASATDAQADMIIAYLAAHFGKLIYINSASVTELQELLTLTPQEAAAVVSYRTQNGDFKTMDDLLKVAGLDTKKIQEQSANIIFAPKAL